MNMTVVDTVLLGRKPYIKWDVTEQDRQIAMDIIRRMDLEKYVLRNVSELSGGEAQKVMLARALAQQPKLLLLDEPTANIDPYTTSEIEKMLLATTDTTIIMVTHNLAQARRVCDNIIMLHEGRIIESGSTAKILTEPETEEARRFIKGELLL